MKSLEKIIVPKNANVSIIGTNRWVPDKCMWVADKEIIKSMSAYIVFPFAELWQAPCHVFVGNKDNKNCYIHLTPLTSFFRKSTDELDKIYKNVEEITGSGENWHFHVYYFSDRGREEDFRKVIVKSLGEEAVDFVEVWPKNKVNDNTNVNMIYHSGKMYYSTQELEKILLCNDISRMGRFNKYCIEAIE